MMVTKKARKALESLKIDPLHGYLHNRFNGFKDIRAENQSLKLADCLMSGYAMFSLKDSSLLKFNNARSAREENLKNVYKIEKAPSDSRMATILDEVEPIEFEPIFKGVTDKIRAAGIWKEYEYFQSHIICSMDGVHHFSSESIYCKNCQEYTKSNGQKEYRHYLLSGAIVHPDKKEVLPIVHEPILRQDGTIKNDCERNAAKRLLPRLRKLLAEESVIIVEDALGSNGPHIRALKKEEFRFVLGVKPDGNKYLFELFNRLKKQGRTNSYQIKENKLIHEFEYANKLPLNSDNRDIVVNFLLYRQIDTEGKKPDRVFSWITDFHLSKRSVYHIMRIGRSRWKIENETFNTLKNQGYNFEHNFGHGEKNLCTVFVNLMMLAFLVDQLQQGWNSFFRMAWNKLQTKKALWEKIRNKFEEFTVQSMKMIYELINGALKVRFEFYYDSG